MKNFSNILRTNKALALTSVAFFLVSIFTITLTLNLTGQSTNTSTKAQLTEQQCNMHHTEEDCSYESDAESWCEWYGKPTSCFFLTPTPGLNPPQSWCTRFPGCEYINCTPKQQSDLSYCSAKTTQNACDPSRCNWNTSKKCAGTYENPIDNDPDYQACRLWLTPTPSPTPPGGGGTPPGGATATPTPPPHSTTECSCTDDRFEGNNTDENPDNNGNFCYGYGAPVNNTRNTCIEANDGPEGYCDRNSDGKLDGDGETIEGHTGLSLGAIAYADRCLSGGNPTNTPAPPPPGASPTPTLAPTPETIYPEANLTHNCSASQDLWPAYDLQLTSINNISQFWQALFSFCLHPVGTYSPDLDVYNKDHTYIYRKFFESKAPWVSDVADNVQKNVDGQLMDLPIWACYSLGRYDEIPGEPGTNFVNHFINGNTILNSPKTRSDGTIYYPTIRELAVFTNSAIAEGKISQFTEFIPKVVLAGFNGTEWRVNDQTILSRDTDGKGHMQLHTGLGTCAPDVTNAPTPTPVPTCEYVTVNVPYSKYIADKPGHTVVNQRYELNDTNLPQLDRTQPLKIGVDWGWTGTDDEFGPLNLPDGTTEDAGPNWQSNEESKVEIQGLNAESISLRNYTPINCPDVGEIKRDAHTLFSDGRAFWFIQDLLNINLRDVSLPDENLRGNWYTCPITASAEPQLSKFTDTEQIRPDNEWLDIPFTDDLAKLRFTKSFTGNDTSTGSHFTRILVRYCKTNIEPTLTVTPTP